MTESMKPMSDADKHQFVEGWGYRQQWLASAFESVVTAGGLNPQPLITQIREQFKRQLGLTEQASTQTSDTQISQADWLALCQFGDTLVERQNKDFPEPTRDQQGQLIAAIQTVPKNVVQLIPELAAFTGQLQQCGWPGPDEEEALLEALEEQDKFYIYKPCGENWRVVGLFATGTEDWVATVATETLAINLANQLN